MEDWKENQYEEDDIQIENAEELNDLTYTTPNEGYVFKEVHVTKKDFSVFELARKYKKGDLILDVSFERKLVWKERQKCELIESILMGLPLPIFYFKQLENGKFVVVDGKQRLSTLFEFLDDKFALKNLKILDFLNKKKFSDLINEFGIYQTQLEDYQVYSHVILPPTPDRILFDIFDRVNRGGTKLNKQEIRNALYQGNGMDMIHNITKGETFERVTRIQNKKDSRMKGAYLLTRYFAFYLYINRYLWNGGEPYKYNGDMDEFIEVTLKYLNKCSDEELLRLWSLTDYALNNAYFYLERAAFRKRENSPINMNLFETTLIAMSRVKFKDNDIREDIAEKIRNVIDSEEFNSYIGNGRDSVQNVIGRFNMMLKIAEEYKL